MSVGYIYIYYLREFLRHNEPVYKIGRSQDIFQRDNGYPKGSKLLYCIHVENMNRMEAAIINKLKKVCVQRTDYGNEYFEGDINLIKHEVSNICISQRSHFRSDINTLEQMKYEIEDKLERKIDKMITDKLFNKKKIELTITFSEDIEQELSEANTKNREVVNDFLSSLIN